MNAAPGPYVTNVPGSYTHLWFARYVPKAGDVIVDVGAGDGADLPEYCRRVGPKGRVHLLECDPELVEKIRSLPDASLPNVFIHPFAAWWKAGSVLFHRLPNFEESFVEAGWTSSLPNTAILGPSGSPVPGLPLDHLQLDHVDFLKMNIEGAEQYALQGAQETLKVTDHLVVAVHDKRADRGDGEFFRTKSWVRQFLIERGFQIEIEPVWDHIHASRGTLWLNLGCCDRALKGFVNVDIAPGPSVDKVADLRETWPWEAGTVDKILAIDVIEHLPDKIFTMNEIHRVLRPGGTVEIFVPTTEGPGAFQDPTHVSFWNRHSFWYFEAGNIYRERFAKNYRITAAFKVLRESTQHTGDGPKLSIVLEKV